MMRQSSHRYLDGIRAPSCRRHDWDSVFLVAQGFPDISDGRSAANTRTTMTGRTRGHGKDGPDSVVAKGVHRLRITSTISVRQKRRVCASHAARCGMWSDSIVTTVSSGLFWRTEDELLDASLETINSSQEMCLLKLGEMPVSMGGSPWHEFFLVSRRACREICTAARLGRIRIHCVGLSVDETTAEGSVLGSISIDC
nr:hypothetical protein Iba_chr08dCG13150 [Ipomoea batatas]